MVSAGAGAADSLELTWPDTAFEPTRLGADRNRLGPYELVYELGSGGMATVYLARRFEPGGGTSWVAIKRILSRFATDERFVRMFIDEARIASSLEHPNIARVHGLEMDRGEYFIVMEFLRGETLGAVAARSTQQHSHPLSIELAAYIGREIARGLHFAHEATHRDGRPLELIHRDVAPQNLIVTYDGDVKITDFGIAKAIDRLTQTQEGDRKGKLAYMAPEQALSRETIDRRADIYSLGVVLWEATVGRRLFWSKDPSEALDRILSGRITAPSALVADYPSDFEAVVMRALAFAPADRFSNAQELADALEPFVDPNGREHLGKMVGELFDERRVKKDRLVSASTSPAPIHHESSYDPEDTSGILLRPGRAADSSTRSRWALITAAALTLAATVGVAAAFFAADEGASLRIESQPSGARVWIDDIEVGNTPLSLPEQAPGRHRVRLQHPAYETFEGSFDAVEGENRLEYELTRSEPTETESREVVASLVGPRGPPSESESDLPTEPELPNEAQSGQSAETQPPRGSEPTPEAGEPTESHPPETSSTARRNPRNRTRTRGAEGDSAEPAFVNVLAIPWARVEINGEAAGNTPIVRRRVQPGPVVIRLQKEGRGSWTTRRLRVRPGQTASRRYRL